MERSVRTLRFTFAGALVGLLIAFFGHEPTGSLPRDVSYYAGSILMAALLGWLLAWASQRR